MLFNWSLEFSTKEFTEQSTFLLVGIWVAQARAGQAISYIFSFSCLSAILGQHFYLQKQSSGCVLKHICFFSDWSAAAQVWSGQVWFNSWYNIDNTFPRSNKCTHPNKIQNKTVNIQQKINFLVAWYRLSTVAHTFWYKIQQAAWLTW